MTPLLDTNNYQTLGNWVLFLLFKTNAHHSSSQYEKEEHVNRRLFQGVKLAWETRLVAKNSGITQLQVVAQSDTTKVENFPLEVKEQKNGEKKKRKILEAPNWKWSPNQTQQRLENFLLEFKEN